MLKNVYLQMVLVAFVTCAPMVVVIAQAPAAPAAAPVAAPVLDKLDQQAVALAVEAGKAANASCVALESWKHFENARALVTAQLKAKYPAYALDWQTQKLAPAK